MTEYEALFLAIAILNEQKQQANSEAQYTELNEVCNCLINLLAKIEH